MSALLPLKYLLPTPGMLLGNTESFRSGFGSSSTARHDAMQKVLKDTAAHALTPPAWESFLREFAAYQVDTRGTDLVRDGWRIFVSAYENPSQRYRDLFISTQEQSIFPGVPQEFLDIVHDVLGDSVNTEAETRYLEEKRLEYRIAKTKLMAITRRHRQMNPIFLKLVMEVCRDGIITPNEKSLLLERAEQCRVEPAAVDELLEQFLGLHKMEAQPTVDPLFASLVGAEAFVRYVLKRPVLSTFITSRIAFFICNASRGGTMPPELTKELCSGLVQAINDFTGFSLVGEFDTLQSLMSNICDIKLENLPSVPTPSVLEQARDADTRQTVLINGLSYHLQLSESRDRPLFTHKVDGTHVYIRVNSAHPFLSNPQPQQVDLVFKIALSATLTKLQHYADSEVIEHFFRDLHVHEPTVERQYNQVRPHQGPLIH